MKIFLLTAFVLTLGISAFAQNTSTKSDTTFNKIVTDSVSGKPMLIGYCTRKAFNDSSFAYWFKPTYEIYTIDTTALKGADSLLKNVNITIVMGSWCSDSKEEVPHFYKILDYLKYPTKNIKLIMVGRDKKANNTDVADLDVDRVPTFIFSRNNKEIGRIIEFPRESLEIDMMRILRTN